ncbi:hypothetical protein [Paenibacillus sp. KN14-4R]|uniref:hypothetical protein n=1 Tax=Paenibacillus sp. KN14-4R TaxID=3445773 RepID=UPI003FA0B4DA
MTTYTTDQSGIHSLSGFSFQIRVFVNYMLSLKEGMQIEFETIDDVNISKIGPKEIDDFEDNYLNKLVSKSSNTAIQVKRTTINESSAEKILINWVLLESSENKISEYVLFTHDEYDNDDIVFKRTAKEYYELIQASMKGPRAHITKVKELCNSLQEFELIYNSICEKYKFISVRNIDEKIDENCCDHFRKAAVNSVIYYQRIGQLIQHITVKIMESINNKQPFILSYADFITSVEEICSRLNDHVMQPLYSEFKKLQSIDLGDHRISHSRQYKQLMACGLPQNLIKDHLIFNEYYRQLRLNYMEANKVGKVGDIEETTFENFENAKFSLVRNKKDEPYNRLEETKKLPNSHADNEQIRYGSCIYLTSDESEDHQISWEDE